MLKSPCKNCPDRYVGCHSKCDDYQDFRSAKDQELETRKKDKILTNDYYSVRAYNARWNRK